MKLSHTRVKFMNWKRASFVLFVLAHCFSLPCAAQAEEYPTRPITMIVPFPPGGSTDLAGRLVAEGMSKALGQKVVVENKAGAAGVIGTGQVARAEPDGYTIGVGTSSSVILVHLLGTPPPYSPSDLAVIGNASIVEWIFVGRPALPYNTIEEVVQAAKKQPGQIKYASSGVGSPVHLAFELLAAKTGIKMVHVPYAGDSPALRDLMGNQVDLALVSIPSAISLVKSGQVKALAMASLHRSAAIPDVPTVAESGVPGYEAGGLTPIIAPKKTPQAIIEKLNKALNVALMQPELAERYAVLGLSKEPITPEQAKTLVVSESEKWGAIVKAANLSSN